MFNLEGRSELWVAETLTAVNPRICVLTAGHLSTCPRMLKAADAFVSAGYSVRVVSTNHVPWSWSADQTMLGKSWVWDVIPYDRHRAPWTYLWTGTRQRITQRIASAIGPYNCSLPLTARAFSRVHTELVRAALSDKADLFYGGTTGGLAATAEAARRANIPYAIDLEDFYSAEHDDTPGGSLMNLIAERIEGAVLPRAAFITTASSAIGNAYREKYRVSPVVVNNTFPLPKSEPRALARSGEPLKLYWFSQTVGPGRGLEEVIEAVGLARISAELHLRGRAIPSYIANLSRLAMKVAPQLVVIHYDPAPPDLMVSLCNDYDVGLAVEQTTPLNRALCLTNKIFTYLLAGLAVVVTDTPGQGSLGRELADGAILYKPGDVATLATGLRRWAQDKSELRKAKLASWQAACRRWHWEHPQERGALLAAVAGALK